MARENTVILFGAVEQIRIRRRDDTGEPVVALAQISTYRTNRDPGGHNSGMEVYEISVMTKDRAVMKDMACWEQYDVVEVKGVLTTDTVMKAAYCEHCGEKQAAEGQMTYVTPIAAKLRERAGDRNAAMKTVSENREFSNIVKLFGTLVREPKLVRSRTGMDITQYQIAMNRKYRIAQDQPDRKTDYPWVKAYGVNADTDKTFLQTGSEILIDGFLRGRTYGRRAVCPHCGKEYIWTDRTTEIIPYSVEYLTGMKTVEQADLDRLKWAEQMNRDLGWILGTDILSPDDIDAGADPAP